MVTTMNSNNKRTTKLFWLSIGNLIASIGTSFMWPLTTVYMHNYLHESLTVAGIVLFFNSLSMILGNYAGGYIYDHWKVKPWLLASIGLSTLAVMILIFQNGWPAYPILLIIDSFGGGVTNTLLNSLATSIEGHTSRYIYNMLYFMMNIGVVVGTMCVGFVVDISIDLIFVINTIMFILFLLIAIFFYFEPQKKSAHHQKNTNNGPKTTGSVLHLIWGVLLIYLVIQIGYSQWQSNLSVYMGKLGIPLAKYSLLWTINGVMIVISQPIVSWVDEHFNVRVIRKLYAGAAFFILAFASLIFAKSYAAFVVSMMIATIAEIYTFPTISAEVDNLSTVAEKGKYQGNVSIAGSAGRAIGPLFGGLMIDKFSYEALFGTMAGAVLIMAVILILLARLNYRTDKE